MKPFFLYRLRTSDVPGARAFYSAVLGHTHAEIFQLHEQAVLRGARPHWLGFIDVGDADAAAVAFTARGATLLGPKWVDPQGLEAAVMRDPGGAILALAKPAPVAPDGSASVARPVVAWHALHTVNVTSSKASYGELFGWDFGSPLDLGSHGVAHPFAWQPGGIEVGWMLDIAERPGVHPHWLFHFRVAALEPALAAVRDGGGAILGPFTLPSGDRVAVCDDPQGAAFALIARK